MAIDSSIALGIRPVQLENPLAQFAQVAQIQQAQNQNRLADLVFGEKQRELAAESAFSNLLAGGKAGQDIVQGLASQGYGNKAMAYNKMLQEQEKQRADIGHLNAQSADLNMKVLNSKMQQQRDLLNSVDNPQAAAAWLKAGWDDPEIGAVMRRTGKTLEQAMSEIPADPKDFQAWKMKSSLGAEQLIKYTTPDANTVANNKTSILTTQMNNATSRANNAETVGVQRERLNWDKSQPKGQVVQTEAGPMLVDPRTANATPVTVGGKPIPSKEAAQKVQDAQSVLNLLDMADPLLSQTTQGYLGAGVDAAAAAFGKSLPGAQSAAQLKALEGALISKMPKMSGPQSDKDVLLYRQMAGQIGDVSVPIETRRAAIKTIRELNQKYAGEPSASAKPAGIKFLGFE